MSKCKENYVKYRGLHKKHLHKGWPQNGPELVVYEKYIEMLMFRL